MKIFKFSLITCLAGFLLVFASCKNQQGKSGDVMLVADSAVYNNNMSSDKGDLNAEHPQSSDKRGTVGTQATASQKQNSSTTNSAKQGTEKKGWSKAAQGAVIGGATGAVGGAIISKDKVAGAAVGAAVGAAGGYIIGRDKDKKDGRVQKKKKHKK